MWSQYKVYILHLFKLEVTKDFSAVASALDDVNKLATNQLSLHSMKHVKQVITLSRICIGNHTVSSSIWN